MKKTALEVGTRVHAELLDGAVTITPRPVNVQKPPYTNQRYVPGPSGSSARMSESASWRLYRSAGDSFAEVRVLIGGAGSSAESCVCLTALELRNMAQACIDMAHDIEVNRG